MIFVSLQTDVQDIQPFLTTVLKTLSHSGALLALNEFNSIGDAPDRTGGSVDGDKYACLW